MPLLAGFLFALSCLMFKRAFSLGVGTMQTIFTSNVVVLPLIIPLYWSDHSIHDLSLWYTPVIAGLLLFGGNILSMYAVKLADVSFQTPLMNTKILMVVIIAYFAGAEVIRWNWWISAFLTVFAVFIMNTTSKNSASPQPSFSPIFWTLGCALLYAICEVYMEIHSPQFGETTFLIILLIVNSIASLAIIPFFEKSPKPLSLAAWGWLMAGSVALAIETVTIYLPITLYGNASVVNILYSSRGLWSLFLVCLVGKWFSNTEGQLPPKILITRAWGAFLLTLGISIIFIP